MFSATQVARYVRLLGFTVTEVEETKPYEQIDGIVRVSPNVHVQVGYDYVVVVREGKCGHFRFGRVQPTMDFLDIELKATVAITKGPRPKIPNRG